MFGTVSINKAKAIADLKAVEAVGRTTGTRLGAIFTKIGKVAKVAFAVVAVAAAGMFVMAIKKAAAFELGMAKVRAISGATAKEFAALTKKAKELGLETAQTMTDIAKGMEEFARAGFEADEIIEAMGGAVALAESQVMDLGEAVAITGAIMKGMRLPADEAVRVVNALAAVAASSATTVDTLKESMKYLAPAAADLKVPLEEALAVVGKLGDAGLKGGLATRAFATALNEMARPTDEAAEVMEKLGIKFFDVNGEFIGIIKTVAVLEKALKGMTVEQKKMALGTMFTGAAVRTWSVLLGVGSEALVEYQEEITNTNQAFDQQAEMLETVMGQWTIMQGSIEALLVAIGGPMLNAIQAFLTDALIPWINSMTNAATGTSIFEKAINKIITPFRWMIDNGQAVKTAFLTIAIGLAAVTIYTHPLTALVIGLGLLVARLVAITEEAPQTVSSFESMGEAIEYWLGVLEGADFQRIISFVKQYREALIEVMEEMVDLGDLSPAVLRQIRNEFALLVESLLDLPPEEMANAFILGADMILSKYAGLYDELGKLRLGYLKGEVKAHEEAVEKITSGYEDMLISILTGQIFLQEQIQKTAEEMEPTLDLLTLFSDEYERLVEQGAPEAMIQGLVRLADSFGIVLGEAEKVETALDTMRKKIEKGFSDAAISLEKIFTSITDRIADAVNNNKEAQKKWGEAVAEIREQYSKDLEQLPIDHKAALDDLDERQARGLVTYVEYVAEKKRLDDLYAENRTTLHGEYRQQMDDEDQALEDQKVTAADVLKSMAEDFLSLIRTKLLAIAAEYAIISAAAFAIGNMVLFGSAGAVSLAALAAGLGLALAGFQKGAVFDSPTLLPPHMVAEKGVSEAYLPLTPSVLGGIGAGIVDALSASPEPALAAVGGSTVIVEVTGNEFYIREDADLERLSHSLADEIDERLTGRGLGRFG